MLRKLFKAKWYLGWALVLLALPLFAFGPGKKPSPKKFHLELSKIEMVESYEKFGDELYFSITEYGGNHSKYHRMPEDPLYWQVKALSSISSVPLWEETLKPGEYYTLLLELTEHDLPPWNPDDLVGVIKVKIGNSGVSPVFQWQLANHIDSLTGGNASATQTKEFVLRDEHGKYKVTLKLDVSEP